MIWVMLYALSIIVANAMVAAFGIISIGFGLAAPAGVYAAGLSFWLRDQVHEAVGWKWTVVAIVVGAGLSAAMSPRLALASGLAFLVSEIADLLVYAPLRRHHRIKAVVGSNAIGSVIDSALFLALAFGSIDFIAGQIVGKMYTVIPVVVGMWLRHRKEGVVCPE